MVKAFLTDEVSSLRSHAQTRFADELRVWNVDIGYVFHDWEPLTGVMPIYVLVIYWLTTAVPFRVIYSF